jgi:4-hydroxy-tetrahydrodipicolinate reductase
MRIGIAGYGRMGVLIHQQAIVCGHEVPVIVDPRSEAAEVTERELTFKSLPLDVIIDFTEPGMVIDNIKRYGDLKVSVVIGTTGWHDKLDQVATIVENTGIGLIWSGNFSLGVNLFFHIVKAAGRVMNRFPQYDAAVHECHHRYKADSPSGTARMLGDMIIDTMERKTSVVSELLNRRIEENELHLSSTRGGSLPGTHKVIFDSDIDTIILEHSARNRTGFAVGAVLAAEWLEGRSGLFTIDDLMQSIIGGENLE